MPDQYVTFVTGTLIIDNLYHTVTKNPPGIIHGIQCRSAPLDVAKNLERSRGYCMNFNTNYDLNYI